MNIWLQSLSQSSNSHAFFLICYALCGALHMVLYILANGFLMRTAILHTFFHHHHHRHRHHHVHLHRTTTHDVTKHTIYFVLVKAFIDADSTNASFLCSLKPREEEKKTLVDFWMPVCFLSDARFEPQDDDTMPHYVFVDFFFGSGCVCLFWYCWWRKGQKGIEWERVRAAHRERAKKMFDRRYVCMRIWPYFLAFIHIINFISL